MRVANTPMQAQPRTQSKMANTLPRKSPRERKKPSTGWLGAKSRSYQTGKHRSGTCQPKQCQFLFKHLAFFRISSEINK